MQHIIGIRKSASSRFTRQKSTISQDVAFGLRRARYRGLVKTDFQHVPTAAALELNQVVAWLEGQPLAPTQISRFAAITA